MYCHKITANTRKQNIISVKLSLTSGCTLSLMYDSLKQIINNPVFIRDRGRAGGELGGGGGARLMKTVF